MFLEPTCPLSVRALGKIDETLALADAGGPNMDATPNEIIARIEGYGSPSRVAIPQTHNPLSATGGERR